MATKIEWTDETWNPIIGCSKVSPGCDHCYAERMAARLAAMEYSRISDTTGMLMPIPGESGGNYNRVVGKDGTWNGKTVFVESALEKPLHWKKPRKIFVCSMSDLFHESVPFEWIDRVFAVMALCPQHIFQVLTKREKVIFKYSWYRSFKWPDNIIGMVTAENQEMADLRIPYLLRCGFKTTSVSCEPLLGNITLTEMCKRDCGRKLNGFQGYLSGNCLTDNKALGINKINQITCGGESGPGARPMHPDHARSLRDQCVAAGVPFFFKQWGEWVSEFHPAWNQQAKQSDCFVEYVDDGKDYKGLYMGRIGKKKAGRLLDGRTWDQCPGEVS